MTYQPKKLDALDVAIDATEKMRGLVKQIYERNAQLVAIELEVSRALVMEPELRARLLVLARGTPERELKRILKRLGISVQEPL